MDTKQRHPVSLKQYRKVGGKWQFVPVARDPRATPIPHRSPRWRAGQFQGGTFYLDFNHHGKRRQESVGMVPRDALEAWRTKLAILTGLIEAEEEPEEVERGLTIDQAIQKYLVEVEAPRAPSGNTHESWMCRIDG